MLIYEHSIEQLPPSHPPMVLVASTEASSKRREVYLDAPSLVRQGSLYGLRGRPRLARTVVSIAAASR